MQAITDVRLHTASVVITANHHNPSILDNNFLVKNKIVGDDWNIVEAVMTPAVSAIKYDNGINWLVDRQRLDIGKEYNVPFEVHDDDKVYRLAAAYVEILQHVPYQNIGLNCVVSIKNEDPLQWVTRKFLKAESWPDGTVMMPRFTIKTGKTVLNFSFGEGLSQLDGRQVKSITIECNHHFAGPFKSIDDMLQILSGWKDTKSIIAARLNEVLV